ncbi:MAG: TonB C-terminal domain-containing protein [Endomicrobium sp.]|nr:TonB C-terminal domain-containing protein [Endomicrobium sp.]
MFISFVFNIREKPVFLPVPVEVSFYSKFRHGVVGRSGVLANKEESSHLDTMDGDKVGNGILKKERKFQKFKNNQEVRVTKTSEDGSGAKNFQFPNSSNISSKTVSHYGALSFDAPDFRYSYYAGEIVKKISEQWKWIENYGQLRVIVYFKIRRNGSVFDVSIKESSSNKEYDRYALDTIHRTAPFPDLPEDYRNDVLGVYFEFKCDKG